MQILVKTFGDFDDLLSNNIELAQAFEMGIARLKVYGDEVFVVI